MTTRRPGRARTRRRAHASSPATRLSARRTRQRSSVATPSSRRRRPRPSGPTVRVTRDIDLAEECVQDAYAKALRVWAERGVPAKPAAWLTTTARNRALDLIRRETTWRRLMPMVVDGSVVDEPVFDGDEIPDD